MYTAYYIESKPTESTKSKKCLDIFGTNKFTTPRYVRAFFLSGILSPLQTIEPTAYYSQRLQKHNRGTGGIEETDIVCSRISSRCALLIFRGLRMQHAVPILLKNRKSCRTWKGCSMRFSTQFPSMLHRK